MMRCTTPLILAGCILGCGVLPGCPPRSDDSSTLTANPPDVAPIFEAHNLNASRLQQIDATGVLQLRWVKPDGGIREEQGEAHLWIDQPRRTALRVSKLGEDLLWLGSDDDRFWLFDLLDDDNTALITHPHGTSLVWGDGDDAIELQPLALLDLMGVSQVQPMEGEPSYDASRGCWHIPARGQAGRLKLCWNPKIRRVAGLILLDDQDDVRLMSSLRRWTSVDVFDGVAFERPQMATLIDFEEPAGKGRLKLALEQEVFGDLEGQPVDRLFSRDVLQRRFQPDEVHGDAGQ